MENKFGRQKKYDYIRVFLTVLVIIGHCAFYNINTPFGGISYKTMMESNDICFNTYIRNFIIWFSNMIYSFHMPVFFTLSGVLFFREYEAGKWQHFNILLKAKTKRLLIPLIFTWLFWNIPIKYISGYYDGVKIKDIFLQIIFPSNVYLWFLEALYIVFLLAYIIRKYIGKNKKVCFLIVFLWIVGFSLQRKNSAWIPLGNPMKYLAWFWLGGYIEGIITFFSKKYTKLKISLFMALLSWFVVYLLSSLYLKSRVRLLRETVLPFFAIVVIWYIFGYVADIMGNKQYTIIKNLSSYSFGVYLYAEPLNYLILFVITKLYGIDFLGKEWGSLVEIMLRLFGTFLAAILITFILKKVKFPVKAY